MCAHLTQFSECTFSLAGAHTGQAYSDEELTELAAWYDLGNAGDLARNHVVGCRA